MQSTGQRQASQAIAAKVRAQAIQPQGLNRNSRNLQGKIHSTQSAASKEPCCLRRDSSAAKKTTQKRATQGRRDSGICAPPSRWETYGRGERAQRPSRGRDTHPSRLDKIC